VASRLPDLLAASAARVPDRDALVMEDRRLSYAGLEEQSSRFAHSLIGHGVRRGDRVALWLPKSPEAVAALWGIMKAGAAYVPIDPGAPPARMAWIARNCEVAGLVTRFDRAPQIEEAFSGRPPMRALWVAEPTAAPVIAGVPAVPWHALAGESAARPDVPGVDADLAYILYTSGSTGEPKGVMLSHRNALAFAEWAAVTFEVGPEDRLANHAPFHFDLSTFDLFAAAHGGAAVYPVPPRIAAFPAAIAKSWCEQKLTVWYATPSTLVLLLTRGDLAAQDLSALRVLLFAGEVMPVKVLRQLMALAPRARFANLYGPTETNVCTWYEVKEPPPDERPLPIGRACCNDETHILDERLKPVPPGGAGELWVRGATVMQGYWGNPERSALALQKIEVAPGLADLAYRTGDVARELPDGNLEFLGRRDHQVKTRGYRVELGEIEAALQSHPAVGEAVAVAVPDEEITNRLRAVVVLKAGLGADEADLKQHCARTLPRYMVPETIEFRSALPRTSSGKVDRRALEEAARAPRL
jgi:amino acid adenylation domain-containing protein